MLRHRRRVIKWITGMNYPEQRPQIQKEHDRYLWEGEVKAALTGVAERISNINDDMDEIKERLSHLPDDMAKNITYQFMIRDNRITNLEEWRRTAEADLRRLIASDDKREGGGSTVLKTATWLSMLVAAWAAIVGMWYQIWPKR